MPTALLPIWVMGFAPARSTRVRPWAILRGDQVTLVHSMGEAMSFFKAQGLTAADVQGPMAEALRNETTWVQVA